MPSHGLGTLLDPIMCLECAVQAGVIYGAYMLAPDMMDTPVKVSVMVFASGIIVTPITRIVAQMLGIGMQDIVAA